MKFNENGNCLGGNVSGMADHAPDLISQLHYWLLIRPTIDVRMHRISFFELLAVVKLDFKRLNLKMV